jgi:hypothetical protein
MISALLIVIAAPSEPDSHNCEVCLGSVSYLQWARDIQPQDLSAMCTKLFRNADDAALCLELTTTHFATIESKSKHCRKPTTVCKNARNICASFSQCSAVRVDLFSVFKKFGSENYDWGKLRAVPGQLGALGKQLGREIWKFARVGIPDLAVRIGRAIRW